MGDIQFKNRAEVKWFDLFDSYFIQTNVSTDTGAEMDLGSTEVLRGKSISNTNTSGLLSFGVVEILGSSTTSVSSGIANLILGIDEPTSSSINISSLVVAYLTMGVAEGLSTTSNPKSNVNAFLTLGANELLGSTSISNSVIGSLMTLGVETLMLTRQNVVSKLSTPELIIGAPEFLFGSSIVFSDLSSSIILGIEEYMFTNTLVNSYTSAELTLGIIEYLTATSINETSSQGLLTIGVVELLGSTSTIISIAPDLSLDLGKDEHLTYSILVNTSVATTELNLGGIEELSSSIEIISNINNTFTVGIVEILGGAIPTTSVAENVELTIGGGIEYLSSTSLVQSNVSSFLILGTTETLSGRLHLQSFIRLGGAWSNLTIGHVELLAHTVNILSIVSHTNINIGIVEPLSYTNQVIKSNVDAFILIGVVELLSSALISSISTYDADLTIGIENELSSSIEIESSCSSFLLMGVTESLSTTININSNIDSNLVIGHIELLASTVFSISITDSDILIGNSEIQTGSSSVKSNTYAVLVLGHTESLSSEVDLVIQSDVLGDITIGEVSVLSSSKATTSTTIATLQLGRPEILKSSSLISISNISSNLILGVHESLNSTTEIISSVNALIELGVIEYLNSTSNISSIVNSILTTGLPEELSATSISTFKIEPILTLGVNEVLLSTSSNITTSSASTLLTGEVEVLASSTFVITILNSYLDTGISEPLSSSIGIESKVSGNVIEGGSELLTGKSNVISFIRVGGRYSTLTLGIIETLSGTSNSKTNINEVPLILGRIESLKFTHLLNGISNVEALLTVGIVEILGVSSSINSVVASDLTLGVEENLTGTTSSESYLISDLSFGNIESLSAGSIVESNVNSAIIIGVVELVSSTVATTSYVTINLFIGRDESLYSTCTINSKVVSVLILGEANQLRSSVDITTSIGSEVYLGIKEILRARTFYSDTINNPSLVLGVGELLSSSIYIQPTTIGRLGVGILEVIAATSITQSRFPGELTLGIIEDLEYSDIIQTNVDAELTLGDLAELSSNISIESFITSLLLVGEVEILSTSNFSISILDSYLTLGVDEPLEHTTPIQSEVSGELTLGIINELTSSNTIVSNVVNGLLTIGVIEILATSNFSIVITEAELTLGEENSLSSAILIQDFVTDGSLIIGVVELLSSIIASTVHFPPAELYIGQVEILSAIINIQPTVSDVLNLGGQENLSSSIIITHLAENTIDLVIGGAVEISGKSRNKVFSRALWLFVPGLLEELSSTVHSNSFVNSVGFFLERELLYTVVNVESIASTLLSLGVVEVASSSSFSMSVVASTLDIGVGNILNSSGTVVSNTVAGDLILGQDEELTSTVSIVLNINISNLIIGVSELVSSSLFSISVTDSILKLGVDEPLSAKSNIVSNIKGFCSNHGELELLDSSINITTNFSTTGLIIGLVELVSNSFIIQSIIPSLSVIFGNNEVLISNVIANTSISTPDIQVGNSESLSSICRSELYFTGSLEKPGILEGSLVVQSEINESTLYIGDNVELSSSVDIITNFDSSLILGNLADLTGTALCEYILYIAVLISPIVLLSSNANADSEFGEGAYLDSNGGIDLFSTTNVELVSTADLTPGTREELFGISIITTVSSTPQFTTGIVELLASSVFSISIIDCQLTHPCKYLEAIIDIQVDTEYPHLSAPWELTGSSTVTTDSSSNIVQGRIELLSSVKNITTNFGGDLTRGGVEFISSVANVTTYVSIPEVIFVVKLSNIEQNLWDSCITSVSEPDLKIKYGYYNTECIVKSSVEADLTLGIAESFSGTAICKLNIYPYLQYYLRITDLSGASFSENECWAWMKLGLAEDFESGSIKAISNVRTDGLIIDVIDLYGNSNTELIADSIIDINTSFHTEAIITSNINSTLSIGDIVVLSHTIIDITPNVSDVDIIFGRDEILTACGFIESHCDGFIYTGVEHNLRSKLKIKSNVSNEFLFVGTGEIQWVFSQSRIKYTNISSYLTLGVIEDLSFTCIIPEDSIFRSTTDVRWGRDYNNQVAQSDVKATYLVIDDVILSSSITHTTSLLNSYISFGVAEELSSSISLGTKTSGHIVFGVDRDLSSVVNISYKDSLDTSLYNDMVIVGKSFITYKPSTLDFIVGEQAPISSTVHISHFVGCEFIIGTLESLSSTILLGSNAECDLYVGYAERLAGSSISISNIGLLEFGEHIEELSCSVNINTKTGAFFNLGVSESLSSTSVSRYRELLSSLNLGKIEILSSSSRINIYSESNTIALNIEHISDVIIQSVISSELTIGQPESLSSSIILSSNCYIDPIIFGQQEILSGKLKIVCKLATYLTMGVRNEYVSSIVNISSNVIASKLVVDTIDRYNRRITADLQYWYDHFMINHKSLNRLKTPFPSVDQNYEQSFVELLFNDDYDKTSYRYLYKQVENRYVWPDSIRSRLMLNPDTANYYVADGDDPSLYNVNVYNIQSHDIIMLDRLLVYRLEPQNATLIGIDYEELDSGLAKMIYIYLELKLTGSFSKYDNVAIFTTITNILETCYETYLTQTVFEHVSSKGT